jgi:hypothetical protein
MERDHTRINPVLAAVGQIWAEFPNMRLGQLLVNAIRPSEPHSELYNIEDTVLVRKLENLAKELRKSGATDKGS